MRSSVPQPPSSDITPEAVYLRRRELLKSGALTLGPALVVGAGLTRLTGSAPAPDPPPAPLLADAPALPPTLTYDTDEPRTPFQAVAAYNNFYEFGVDKDEPAQRAQSLRPRPWTIEVSGEVARPRTIDIDDLMSWLPVEERVYRMRC